MYVARVPDDAVEVGRTSPDPLWRSTGGSKAALLSHQVTQERRNSPSSPGTLKLNNLQVVVVTLEVAKHVNY